MNTPPTDPGRDAAGKEGQPASGRLTESLGFLAAAIGAWFEHGADSIEFEPPLLNARAARQ
jgi:hypothetical protein